LRITISPGKLPLPFHPFRSDCMPTVLLVR
jgi:hypothetical protein